MRSDTGSSDVAAARDLHPARLLGLCATKRLARRIILYDAAASTNASAMAAVADGARGGTLFVADAQTAGKGRKGRAWFSTKGKSLTFSLLLRPATPVEGLTPLLALAVLTAMEDSLAGLAVKWPNDIFLNGKKLGGILAESIDDAVVLGLGLDVNEGDDDFPAEIAAEAISMRLAGGRAFDRGIVLCRILEAFEDLYDRFLEGGLAPFRENLERALLYIGEPVVIETGGASFEGAMIGITDEGRLRLEIDGAERVFSAGDLTLRGGSRGTDSRA
jgi:BirA family biotin operon repressor/biotin-[acetyl-CoA-carboxylase] ligase